MEEITKHFHKDDMPWIQGIPIDLYMEDTLIWPFTPNGQYIVKSGYRVGREMNLNPTRCSNMTDIQNWRKMMWSLQLLSQMKLFGWRVCHNWLLAKTILIHRGMDINPRCDLCGRYDETLTHALWSCDKVKNIWKPLPWYKKCSSLGEGSMFDFLMAVEQKIDRYEFEDTIKVMWAIWENRNRQWNHLPSMNRKQLINWLFSAYPNATIIETTAIQHEALVWGLVSSGEKADGQIISVGMIYMDNICTAKTAEAWAILEAPKKPPATDTDQIELQTDCRMLVEEIENQGQSFNADSTILHKIKNLLETFHSVNIIHVKRTNNECANIDLPLSQVPPQTPPASSSSPVISTYETL
ncbi:hypothetical protein G4B88_007939 [Cannabis sativa]|uniref:RNase H type-1 domain-containing protein n=1 Tax=Cannabis sativa TaxID=3483 RepID=A0A7J6I6V6_CANSA|nr:hypothetical protein G4B88_007939 [Cannabis sativa]